MSPPPELAPRTHPKYHSHSWPHTTGRRLLAAHCWPPTTGRLLLILMAAHCWPPTNDCPLLAHDNFFFFFFLLLTLLIHLAPLLHSSTATGLAHPACPCLPATDRLLLAASYSPPIAARIWRFQAKLGEDRLRISRPRVVELGPTLANICSDSAGINKVCVRAVEMVAPPTQFSQPRRNRGAIPVDVGQTFHMCVGRNRPMRSHVAWAWQDFTRRTGDFPRTPATTSRLLSMQSHRPMWRWCVSVDLRVLRSCASKHSQAPTTAMKPHGADHGNLNRHPTH